MIPVPNLDDRRYRDIVNEAITLIPKYCPEWTNHNPADPGITMIELFAWMTEMIIYRLNRVSEKNYLSFLNMVGIQMRPPQPATALVSFAPVDGGPVQVIPAGTQVATARIGDDEPMIFETVKELAVLSTKISRCFSQDDEDFTDNGAFISDEKQSYELINGFDVFRGRRQVERMLYLGDERFLTVQEDAMLALRLLDVRGDMARLTNLVEWEYWNGRRWREIHPSPFELERGVVAFEGMEGIEPTDVEGKLPELPWIRARLVEVPSNMEDTVLDLITGRIEVLGDGVKPEWLYSNVDSNTYLKLDVSRSFYPFDKNPKLETTLYLCHDELMQQLDSHVRIDFVLADPTIIDPPSPSEDLTINWEFWQGKRWQLLGKITPSGVEESLDAIDFVDTTKAFSQSGHISFRRPKAMAATEVNKVEALWIRARISKGDFGQQGRYELEGDTWVWRHENPLKPPALKDLTIKFIEDDKPIQQVFTYNDFKFSDETEFAASDGKKIQVFQPLVDENPALYLGFQAGDEGQFPNRPVGIHFEIVETAEEPKLAEYEEYLARKIEEYGDEFTHEQRLVWEYSDGKKWVPLPITDQTFNFSQSGLIEFIGPRKHAWKKVKRFAEELYWMRCRLEMGGYDQMPKISRILLNSAQVVNHLTIKGELLGSSRGTPNQRFEMARKPVLSGEVLYVRETEMPGDEEKEILSRLFGDDAIEESTGSERGYWVRWRRVETFYGHDRDSRVYMLDAVQGSVVFGDGIHGMMPPEGNNNIVVRQYHVGGGARGNVGSYSINVMRQPIPYIESVTNHFPARGGADAESIEEVKMRGPHVIKSKDRAVTASDFEWLAKEASSGVARAKCVESGQREGQVTVVVVPRFELVPHLTSAHLAQKLLPSNELLRRVRVYLDERRLIGCMLSVEKPKYVELSLTVELVREPGGSSEDIKAEVEFNLRKFLHPILGGRNGRGWPFGRVLHKVDLYNVAEEVAGVEFVERVEILDEDRTIQVEAVNFSPTELPQVIEVTVIEKARETIRR